MSHRGALQGFHPRTPNNILSSTNADISVIRDICLNSDASQTIEEVSEGGESTDDESLVSISSNENAPKNTKLSISKEGQSYNAEGSEIDFEDAETSTDIEELMPREEVDDREEATTEKEFTTIEINELKIRSSCYFI